MDKALSKRIKMSGLFKELDPYVNPNGPLKSHLFRPVGIYEPSIEMCHAVSRARSIFAIPANTESEAALMARRAKRK